MLEEILLGSVMILLTILISGLMIWLLENALRRWHGFLVTEPHGPKLMLLLAVTATGAISVVTFDVWLWAVLYELLGVFNTFEEAIYYSIVSFTTLGYGDVVLPPGWRILGGMTAANGFLTFGLVVALLTEALRAVRLGQMGRRR